MIAIICGDRYWEDWSCVESVLTALRAPEYGLSSVIEGDCEGADRIAGGIAKMLGMAHHAEPAKWDLQGKVAGPVRNRVMLARLLADPDPVKRVIAFHNKLAESRGTRDMLKAAHSAGVECWHYTSTGMPSVWVP